MEGSIKYLRALFEEYYNCACNVSRPAPICWASTFVPVEILRAMDIDVFYPESYSAAISSRRGAKDFFYAANSDGFSQDICSYARLFQGALEKEYFPYGKLRRPDFLIGTNNQCGTIAGWWRFLAEKFDIPLFMLDFPGDKGDDAAQYVRAQIDELISFLEKIKGKSLSKERLASVVDISAQTSEAWGKCLAMRRHKLGMSQTARFMDFLFPVVVARGTELALNFYRAFLSELEAERDNPQAQDEGLRILWLGYPFWFASSRVFPAKQEGASIVMDNYTGWWDLPLDKDAPVESIADTYNSTYLNRSLDARVEEALALVKDFNIDGVIIHINKSCKRDAIFQKTIKNILSKEGVPSVIIEADMCDREAFSERRIEEAAELLVENINIRKNQ